MGLGKGNYALDPVFDQLYKRCVEYDVIEVKEITHYDNPDDLTIEIHLTKTFP